MFCRGGHYIEKRACVVACGSYSTCLPSAVVSTSPTRPCGPPTAPTARGRRERHSPVGGKGLSGFLRIDSILYVRAWHAVWRVSARLSTGRSLRLLTTTLLHYITLLGPPSALVQLYCGLRHQPARSPPGARRPCNTTQGSPSVPVAHAVRRRYQWCTVH